MRFFHDFLHVNEPAHGQAFSLPAAGQSVPNRPLYGTLLLEAVLGPSF